MTIVAILAVCLFIYFLVEYLVGIIESANFIKKSKTKPKQRDGHHNIAIVIPLYDEASIIRETVDYFRIVSHKTDLPIYFVSTRREGKKNMNPTHIQVERLIKKDRKMKLVFYPGKIMTKAAQINYVMQKVSKSRRIDYFAVFDADSKPDIHGIRFVQNYHGMPDVFQMPTSYTATCGKCINNVNSIFQTRWTYCYEIPHWIRWSKGKNPTVCYLVGHGLFIKNGLCFADDSITEDLDLGYRLSASSRTSFCLVPFFDLATTPNSFSVLTMQSSRWFVGEIVTIPKLFGYYISNKSARYLFEILLRCAHIVPWIFGVPALVVIMFIGVLTRDIMIVIMLISLIICYIYLLHLPFIGKLLSIEDKIQVLAILPIRCTIIFMGPIATVVQLMTHKTTRKAIDFNKTIR